MIMNTLIYDRAKLKEAIDTTLLNIYSNMVVTAVRLGNEMMQGRRVKLKVGRYKDREGVIKGVSTSSRHGLCYCIYVYRKGTTEILNSDGESRQYRPWSEFELLP